MNAVSLTDAPRRIRCPRSIPAALAVAVGLFTASSTLAQTTYYVRKTGSDSASGKTPSSAFATVSKAMATAGAGDTTYIGAGLYSESLESSRSGDAGSPIVFTADIDGSQTGDAGLITVTTSGKPVLDIKPSDNLRFTGIIFSGGTDCVTTQNSTGIEFFGCTFRAMTSDAISITNTTGLGSVTLDGCTITSGAGRGLVINQNARVIVRDTVFSALGGTGIVLAWPNSTLDLTRCRIESVGQWAVDVEQGVAQLANLLVRTTASGGIRAGSHSSVNVAVVNCTLIPGTGPGVQQNGAVLLLRNSIITQATVGLSRTGGTTTHDHNLYFACTADYSGVPAGSSDLFANPQFTSASDFRPIPASPAVDSGTDVTAITVSDLDRKVRPMNKIFDRGCYEFGSTPTIRIIKWEERPPD